MHNGETNKTAQPFSAGENKIEKIMTLSVNHEEKEVVPSSPGNEGKEEATLPSVITATFLGRMAKQSGSVIRRQGEGRGGGIVICSHLR